MLEVTDNLKQEVLSRKDEIAKDGYHQTILNIMYKHWQKDDVNMSYTEILEWFKNEYGELGTFAVQIGKYNQQVCNGGHFQYYHNGYTGDIDEYSSDIPLHKQLVVLMSKSELKNETSLQLLKLLDELYIEVDTEQYLEEELTDEFGDIVIDEYENTNYMEIINSQMLNNFDNEYYKINDKFMEILEQYFKDKIININPIWDYIDDYYFGHIEDIEINIRIFQSDDIGVWLYDHTKDKEILDEDYKNLEEVKVVLKDIFKTDIDLPSTKQLKIIRGA